MIIQQLAAIRAPSGLEGIRATAFIDICKQYVPVETITKDAIGNVIIHLPPSNPIRENIPKIIFMAHMDEIGGTVFKIQKDGKIHFIKRGGFENRWLISQKVSILNLKGEWINGIILGRTVHAIPPDARNKIPVNTEELDIYIGANSDEEVVAAGIHVGAPIVFEKHTSILNASLDPDILVSNSFDDIVGLSVLLEMAARFGQENPFQAEIILAAVVREEIGCEGSRFLGKNNSADLCVGLDFAVIESDKAGLDCGGNLKGGPMITWAEAEGRGIFNYDIAKEWVETAIESKLPYQHGVFEFYGSDAGLMQREFGIPSVLLGIPMLAGHNNLEIIALSQVGETVDLISAYLKRKYNDY
jgi:endoglucanase